jgi:ATP-dependent DNA helicase DinG
MAQAVARALQSGDVLVVEAGTGVGKTFAYLVPLLLSGRRALLSTATQALQDQLFTRDVPAVSRALGLPVRAALLKGRSSYVCLHRLEQARTGPGASARRDPGITWALEQIQRWAVASSAGDLAELPGLDERSPLRPMISSTTENCLGAACPRVADCHVERARAEAQQADWVVINHHLFFADQRLRRSGAPPLLPEADVLVFDEAHQLNAIGLAALGLELGSVQLLGLARDLAVQGPCWARGQRPWEALVFNLEQSVQALALLAPSVPRSRWRDVVPEGVEASAWSVAIQRVAAALNASVAALQATAGASAELQRLLERAQTLQRDWSSLVNVGSVPMPEAGNQVRWIDWSGGSWRLVRVPRDASAHFGERWMAQPGHSAVFTSATLGNDDSLAEFTSPLGLAHGPQLRTLRVPSPFNHAVQAALYLPHALPEPSDPGHTLALARSVADWASRLGGRTLVLTTTLRAAARMADQIAERVRQGHCKPLRVLAQGQHSRRALLAHFRAAQASGPGAVLVASASFWEGVDLAGDVLQLLVIDKLPFPPPDDPLIEARAEQLKGGGRNPFTALHLPLTELALKQGAGRLIRSETDRGVLVIGDRRLLTKSYGNRLLAALPPMRRLEDESDLLAELDALVLTRASTRDRRTT